MAQYSSGSLGKWVRTASGWKRQRAEEPDAGDRRSGASVNEGNRKHPPAPGRHGEHAYGGRVYEWYQVNGCISLDKREIIVSHEWLNDDIISAAQFLMLQDYPRMSGLQPPTLQQNLSFQTENVQIESETTESGQIVEGQIHVIIPNSGTSLVYLDTSRRGLLYEPEIPEGNLSTNFNFDIIGISEAGVSFYLESPIIQDAQGTMSSDEDGDNEYGFTLQVTTSPSVLVAEPSRPFSRPIRYAVYTDITDQGQTQRAYLLPNNTENQRAQQNPRRRTITAHVDPATDPDVFEDFGSPIRERLIIPSFDHLFN